MIESTYLKNTKKFIDNFQLDFDLCKIVVSNTKAILNEENKENKNTNNFTPRCKQISKYLNYFANSQPEKANNYSAKTLSSLMNIVSSSKLDVHIVVNSLSSNNEEFSKSNEILEYLTRKGITYTTFDINQEMVLEDKNKVKKNIRQYFKTHTKLLSINGSLSIPQIKIGSNLILNYDQFFELEKFNILEKILEKEKCTHVRFEGEDNRISYCNNESEGLCVYCYSEKKLHKKFSLFVPSRNSKDEICSLILGILEENNIIFEVYDIENVEYELKRVESELKEFFYRKKDLEKIYLYLQNCLNEKTPFFLYQDKIFSNIEDLLVVLDKEISRKANKTRSLICDVCGDKLEPSLQHFSKCLQCIYADSSQLNSCNNSSAKKNLSNKKIMENNFIEKLGIQKVDAIQKLNFESNLKDKSNNSITPKEDRNKGVIFNMVKVLDVEEVNNNFNSEEISTVKYNNELNNFTGIEFSDSNHNSKYSGNFYGASNFQPNVFMSMQQNFFKNQINKNQDKSNNLAYSTINKNFNNHYNQENMDNSIKYGDDGLNKNDNQMFESFEPKKLYELYHKKNHY